MMPPPALRTFAFKAVNDTHGHAAGNEVLRRMAAQVHVRVRRSDLAGRISGEAFSVFLPDTHEAQALMLAEKLRASIEVLSIEVGDPRLRITASIGVAASSRSDGSMAQLQQQADTAMYRAKAQGRNRVSNLKAGS
jgi:diguanylate cyclase (GGDEF)-like protein